MSESMLTMKEIALNYLINQSKILNLELEVTDFVIKSKHLIVVYIFDNSFNDVVDHVAIEQLAKV